MYKDFAGIVRGTAKTACAVGRYRLLPQVLIPSLLLALQIAPWMALVAGAALDHPWLAAVGAFGGLMQILGAAWAAHAVRLGAVWALFAPLGGVVMQGIILVTGVAAHWHGCVEWRGTRYPLAALRAGSRFRWP